MQLARDILIFPLLIIIIAISYWYGFKVPAVPPLEELQPVTGRIMAIREKLVIGKHIDNEIHFILGGMPAIFVINKGDNLTVGNWLDDNSLSYEAIKASLKKDDEIKLWALQLPERNEAFNAEFYDNRNHDDVVNTGFENPSGLSSFNEGPAPKTIDDLSKYEVQQLVKDGQVLVDYRTMSAAHKGVKKFFVITFYSCLVILGFLLLKYLFVVVVSITQERKAKSTAGPE